MFEGQVNFKYLLLLLYTKNCNIMKLVIFHALLAKRPIPGASSLMTCLTVYHMSVLP